jgi:phage protein D
MIANGSIVPGVMDVEVISNGHLAADRFSAQIALDASGGYSDAFWASAPDIRLDVQFSVDSAIFIGLITGTVDTMTMDPVRRTVHVSGRDLSSSLIESRIQESFANRTSSEIAAVLAERHGLAANVTSTQTLVGRYYQNEHDRITLDQFSRVTTEWDLLAFLARQEGFGLSVTGTQLNFGPSQQAVGPSYGLTPSDCISLRLERSLTLARDIEVTVKTWNSHQCGAFSQTVRRIGSSASSFGQVLSPQQYAYVRPNLTPDQALRLANETLAELTRHERTIEIMMPGDLALSTSSPLSLSGTNTDFDQLYSVDVIERRFSHSDGFTQCVRAVNANI